MLDRAADKIIRKQKRQPFAAIPFLATKPETLLSRGRV